MAATQAKDPGTQLHYLRTSNPLNPENLAVYPQPAADQPAEPVPAAGRLRRARRRACRSTRTASASRPNLIPTITNTPLTIVNDVVDAVPTRCRVAAIVGGIVPLPPIGLPPIPQVPLTPEQAEALIPDELLQRIQDVRVRRRRRAGVAAPPCRKQGPFSSAASARSTRT